MQIYLPIAEVSVNAFLLLGLGGIVGILSGMFGVGGGFLMTPLLFFIGIPPAVAVATDDRAAHRGDDHVGVGGHDGAERDDPVGGARPGGDPPARWVAGPKRPFSPAPATDPHPPDRWTPKSLTRRRPRSSTRTRRGRCGTSGPGGRWFSAVRPPRFPPGR